jgi:chemotaxis-related protein WspD
MKTDLSQSNMPSLSSLKLNDCWNKIGVWGDRECPELKRVIHCRNCIVYSSAAAQLLGAELPPDYLGHWATHFAAEPIVQSRQRQAAFIFRIGAEWLALSPTNLQEVVESRPIHSVPRGRNDTLLGLVNIRGELLVCVALDKVLGLEKTGSEKLNSKRGIYRRMVVAGCEGQRFVFSVEEVHGIQWFNSNELKGIPVTVARTEMAFFQGILTWQNKSVGCLDDKFLFDTLNGSLT